MSFASYSFILLFFPISVALYHIIRINSNGRNARIIIITASLLFCYLAGGLTGITVLALSAMLNWFLMQHLLGHDNKKPIFILGIILNCAILLSFKYVFPNINGIVLPLGISFYTFQNIELLFSAYENRPEVSQLGFLDYLFYETFFPKLAQGPITEPDFFIKQIHDSEEKKVDWEKMSKGLFLFSIGLAKKTMLADRFKLLADAGFSSVAEMNSIALIISILSFTVQLYFDFSGYSDMARGISSMLGLDLPINFNSPYKAVSISDFWKRWHMTLTHFLTRYVYIPLGGNRKGKARTYVNILVVFLISGIWHGTGFNFIVWGLMHGVAMVIHRWTREKLKNLKIPSLVGWFFTMTFVVISWVFFRASSLSEAIFIIKRIMEFDFSGLPEAFKPLLQPSIAKYLIPQGKLRYLAYILVDVAIPFFALFIAKNSDELAGNMKADYKTVTLIALLFALGTCSLTGISTFVYMSF